LRGIPFVGAIGLTAEACTETGVWLQLPLGRSSRVSADEPHACEGLTAAAVDQAGSVAVWAELGLTLPHATLSLDLSFIRPALGAGLRLYARLVAAQAGLAHTDIQVQDASGAVVAQGAVAYALGSYPGDAGPSKTFTVEDPSRLEGALIPPVDGACFAQALGLAPAEGAARHLGFRTNLVGARETRALHGGVIAAGCIVQARDHAEPGFGLRHFSLEYLRSGLAEATRFVGRVVARSRRTCLVEVDALQGKDRLVARAAARFYRADPPPL
jgi:acyl-coenzyme A thioesterase PaaI-like protein